MSDQDFHALKRMSTALAPSVALMGISLGIVYTIRNYYLPLKDRHAKDKEHIMALEEEIFRLKREMRICGITAPPCLLTSHIPTSLEQDTNQK